jgi:hypothetical protein
MAMLRRQSGSHRADLRLLGNRSDRSSIRPEVVPVPRWILGLFALTAAGVAAYRFGYAPWRRSWLAQPCESSRPLPGDELVPDADYDETMAITIDAPAARVWPWLLQMGYGRGGWYSYDAIDLLGRSTREVVPELQDLDVGAMVPFAPGMGFRVDVLEPGHALVLYGDDEVAQAPLPTTTDDGAEEPGPGLRLAGLLSDANMRSFQVSWAFVLEPEDGLRTRLLERFRTRSTPGPAAMVVRPLVDLGHFLMTRKQLLGIRERVETSAPLVSVAPAAPTAPAPVA